MTYQIIQKWGRKIKRKFLVEVFEIKRVTYEDFGVWMCKASNGVPDKSHFVDDSLDLNFKSEYYLSNIYTDKYHIS